MQTGKQIDRLAGKLTYCYVWLNDQPLRHRTKSSHMKSRRFHAIYSIYTVLFLLLRNTISLLQRRDLYIERARQNHSSGFSPESDVGAVYSSEVVGQNHVTIN